MKAVPDGPFGARLKRLREEAGLTQEELASRSGLTAKGISALERGERRRPYPHTVRSLADALGLAEGERTAFVGLASGHGAPAPPPGTGVGASAIPPAPPTRLIGRERELDEVGGMLRRGETRLLTLTGAGGIGKTRLALEMARAAEDFPDGVIFVPLASLRDADLVGTAVSQALGLRETGERNPFDAVRAHLREKKVLLVLDNFEHVAEAAPEVPVLIEACKDATVLVTSRAPLRVRGEQEYPVPPLRLPVSGEVLGSPSGRLFVERAQAASPAFGLSTENAGAVAEICRRLDGLPLALELAAARTRFLDPASLLKRLDRALSSGGAARDLPERQRTMRAALDWSHDLLSGDEKVLFRRLSVFAGGWTLEAAEAVGAGEGVEVEEVLELLGRLVEQSLVLVETGGGLRYRMLEPVRQYALEKLGDVEKAGETSAVQGEEGRVRERHAGYYLALAEEAGPGLKGPDQGLWVRRLVTELDNTRAALAWAVENGGAERIAQMAWASWTFWWTSGNINEGRRWMEEALVAEPDLPVAARAKLLFVAATLGQALGDFEATRPMIEESRTLFERLGDRRGVGDALGTAGLIALGLKRPDEGLALMERSIDLDLEVGNEWGAAAMLGFSATVPFARGDLGRARRLAERGLALAREIGARDITYVTLYPLAAIALAEGDHERARALFEEGASLSLEVGEKVNVAFCLEGLAAVAASGDEPERAARLWGAAEAMLEEAEIISYPYASDRSLHRRRVSEARARLEDPAWTRAWAEGGAMTAEEAVAYALEGDEPNPPA